MIVKQSKQLEFDSDFNAFFPLKPGLQTSFSFIITFFFEGFSYFKEDFYLNNKLQINLLGEGSIGYENVNVSIDNVNNLIYISEVYYDEDKPTTLEIEQFLDTENFIELCKIGFLNHASMTKENFIHILLSWDKAWSKSAPFALLYQDDKNWFDVLPFDSKEAMEKFVADHTKK